MSYYTGQVVYSLPSLSWMKMVAWTGLLVTRELAIPGSTKSTTKEIVNCSVPSGLPSSVMLILKHLVAALGSLLTVAATSVSWKSVPAKNNRLVKVHIYNNASINMSSNPAVLHAFKNFVKCTLYVGIENVWCYTVIQKIPYWVTVRGQDGVAGEGMLVGEPMFRYWSECIRTLLSIQTEYPPLLLACVLCRCVISHHYSHRLQNHQL